MKRAQTMFGRVAVVVFAGLALAHALTFAVLLYERGLLARDMMASYLGSEVASALAILDRRPADLVLIDPDLPYVLDKRRLKSRSKNSPFDEARLEGIVQATLVGGHVVYEAPAA